jgi:hypothetical protein
VTVRHVFLSYAQADSAAADVVQAVLEVAGVRVWRDTAQIWPGEDWRAKIRQAITGDALVFVALFSRASLAVERSRHNEELKLAIGELQQRQPEMIWLIPVLVDGWEIPDWDIGAGRTLRSLQPVDISGSDRAAQLIRLAEIVTRLAGNSQPPAGARVPPAYPPQVERVATRSWTSAPVLWTVFGAAVGVLALIIGPALATKPATPHKRHNAIGPTSPPVHYHPAAHHRSTPPATPASTPPGAVVATFHGTGQENTPRFTVPATWKLIWQYNCASFGEAGNFAVNEDGIGGQVSVNELGKGGHGATFGYSDAGSHYLQVNSVCRWQLKIVTG